jgi:geranylgeranyl diphosphate synthase type II
MPFDLEIYASERREWVDKALDSYLPRADEPPANLHAAIRYSLFIGGKRLRPLLALAGAEVAGADPELALPLACALECIHTFSLIHDDLPAIDNDDLRRGHPTNHKVYGEAVAILAGDALLTLAFELIQECRFYASSEAVLDVIAMVSSASGTRGMVGGQVTDIECEGKSDLSIATVESIHARKTGALLSASLIAGARLGGASAELLASLREYGHHMGLAFQITDDLLDLQGDADRMGKPVGSDLKNDKATYPKILGIEASQALARESSDSAIAALADLGPEAEPLRALARYMIERDS